MTREQEIALEAACELAAVLLQDHTNSVCCCRSLGGDLSDLARQYPTNCLRGMRALRDGLEGRPCSCCARSFSLVQMALMTYEYELSMRQIEEILSS